MSILFLLGFAAFLIVGFKLTVPVFTRLLDDFPTPNGNFFTAALWIGTLLTIIFIALCLTGVLVMWLV